jgi:bifunctional UDP-N-acetylglucosamine pyrophosphorylase/glucosamine-1-phosphate N-acetyltransferase
MYPLAGRPVVCYVVDAARSLEPRNLAMVVGYGAESIQGALGDQITYVTQEERLGTGHAVQQAEQATAGQAEHVLVLYGDMPLIRAVTLRQMVDDHQATEAAVTLLTFEPEEPAGYGRIVRDAVSGRVQAIVEEADATPQELAIREASSGVLCFRDEWLWPNLARLERRPDSELYLNDLAKVACEQGERVNTVTVSDALEVMGLDDRVKLARAEVEVRHRINEKWMLAGVALIDPASTYIGAEVEVGRDTEIWPNTYLQGQTRIGRNCTIGPGSVIRDSSIGDGCRVELSVVEQAVMERGSDVGPFGHLRKGAHLGPGAHMGNFGELKNSYLGPGAKMGHMSYLGDTTVGAGANIGAGTITCNYDGQRKHPTVIGEGAFIGSDTMLVAPVEIGDGAKTGAGSVVTRDVPPGSLAYGVPARVKHAPEAPEVE